MKVTAKRVDTDFWVIYKIESLRAIPIFGVWKRSYGYESDTNGRVFTTLNDAKIYAISISY